MNGLLNPLRQIYPLRIKSNITPFKNLAAASFEQNFDPDPSFLESSKIIDIRTDPDRISRVSNPLDPDPFDRDPQSRF